VSFAAGGAHPWAAGVAMMPAVGGVWGGLMPMLMLCLYMSACVHEAHILEGCGLYKGLVTRIRRVSTSHCGHAWKCSAQAVGATEFQTLIIGLISTLAWL